MTFLITQQVNSLCSFLRCFSFLMYIFHISGKWQHVKETTEIGEGKLFSPGNLRATSDNLDYAKVYLYSHTSKGSF